MSRQSETAIVCFDRLLLAHSANSIIRMLVVLINCFSRAALRPRLLRPGTTAPPSALLPPCYTTAVRRRRPAGDDSSLPRCDSRRPCRSRRRLSRSLVMRLILSHRTRWVIIINTATKPERTLTDWAVRGEVQTRSIENVFNSMSPMGLL